MLVMIRTSKHLPQTLWFRTLNWLGKLFAVAKSILRIELELSCSGKMGFYLLLHVPPK